MSENAMTAKPAEMPDFLKAELATNGVGGGMELLKKKVVPARIKIIQATAGAELLATYNVGDVILSPANVPVIRQLTDERNKPVGKSEEFFFVPLFYYPEFIITNPYELASTLPMVRERTLDIDSKLAKECQVFDLRKFTCPEDSRYECTRSECFNFMVFLMSPAERYGDIVCLTLRGGEYKNGQRFASLIQSRKAPNLYANLFAATCSLHKHKSGNPSYGLDIENPKLTEFGGPGHWVTDYDLYQFLGQQAADLQAMYNDRTLEVDYTDDSMETTAAPAVNPDGSAKY